MGGVAFEPDDLGGDRNLVAGVFGNRQVNLAADERQVSRQINKRAVRPDIFGQAFLDHLFAVLVLPTDTDRK